MDDAVTRTGSAGVVARAMNHWDEVEKWAAGILMACALCLSFYGVVARYVLQLPLD